MADKESLSVTYTPLCNARGGVEADLTVTRLPDEGHEQLYYFAAGGNTLTKDFDWISRVLDDKGFNATLTNATKDIALLTIQGPHSRDLLQPLVTSGHSLEGDAFPFSSAQQLTLGGVDLLCLRLTFVGELGYELHIPVDKAEQVYLAVREAGERYQEAEGVPVRDCGYRAIDSLSAEKGYRHWHADLTNRDTPMEANIGFTTVPKLKITGLDFLGRQALEEHQAQGLQRKLVCLTLDKGNDVPLHGLETIWRDAKCVGYVRSTAYGHSIEQSIAYGYVDCPPSVKKITNKWLSEGEWQIGNQGAQHTAMLHLKAPFDPSNERIKGNYV